MYVVTKRDSEGRRVVTSTICGIDYSTTFEDNPIGHYAHEMFIRGALANDASVFDEVWGQFHNLETGSPLIEAF